MDTTFGFDAGAGGGQELVKFSNCGGPPYPMQDYVVSLFVLADATYARIGSDNQHLAYSDVICGGTVTQIAGFPNAALRDSAGRFIVADGLQVLRFTSSFQLDGSFGSGGAVSIEFPGYTLTDTQTFAIALDHAGRIIVAGQGTDASDITDMVAARLTTSGGYDGSFGLSGRQAVAFAAQSSGARSVAIADDDGVLLGGFVSNAGTLQVALVRLTAAGTPDTSFNATGKLVTAVPLAQGSSYDPLPRVRVDHTGRILVQADDRLMRFLDDGTPDAAFLGSDPASTPGMALVAADDFAERSDATLMLTGSFGVARLLENGADDNSFNAGTNSRAICWTGYGCGGGYLLIDAGRPVVFGTLHDYTYNIDFTGIARLQSDLVFRSRFGD